MEVIKTPELYKKWPNEEIFQELMLQYDLSKALNECMNIPFQIISRTTLSYDSNLWTDDSAEIEIILDGIIIFEKIRHCVFAAADDRYITLGIINNLSSCLKRLHELCIQYCWSYK